MRRALGRLALLLALAACAPGEQADQGSSVVLEEARFRVTLVAPGTPGTPSEDAAVPLMLRIETLAPWHVALAAPVTVELEAPPAARFEPASFSVDDAAVHTEDEVAFSTALHAAGAEAESAHGRIKFGICKGQAERCDIIRRELELPLAVALSR